MVEAYGQNRARAEARASQLSKSGTAYVAFLYDGQWCVASRVTAEQMKQIVVGHVGGRR